MDQILEEVRAEELYHITTLDNAINIIRKNVFKLSPGMNRTERNDMQQDKYFFGSFARHPVDIFGRSSQVIFVLDQRKLKQKYKFIQFTYQRIEDKPPMIHEFEEKLLSNFPYIKNFNSYIKEIYVNQKRYDTDFEEKIMGDIYRIENLAKQNNIEIYFTYEEHRRTENNRSLRKYMVKNKTEPYEFSGLKYGKYKSRGSEYEKNNLMNFKNQLNMIYNVMFGDENKIIPKIDNYFSLLSYKSDEFYGYLAHEVLNNRKYDPQIRVLLPKIVKMFEKANVKTVEQFKIYLMQHNGIGYEKVSDLKKSLKENRENPLIIAFYNDITGYHHGQTDGTLYAYDPNSMDKNIYGHLTGALYEDKVYIHYIEVKEEFRRNGIATRLFDQLKNKEFPDKKIIHTNSTSDGGKGISSLKESVNDRVLYHATSEAMLYNILRTNSVILSMESNLLSSSDNIHKYPYYLSTARSTQSDFFRAFFNGPKIEFDKDLVEKKYKIIPFNFYADGDYYENKLSSFLNRQKKKESEDRILSKDPEIKDISKYIKAVHILYVGKTDKILNLCKKLNIKVILYKNLKDFRILKNGEEGDGIIDGGINKKRESYGEKIDPMLIKNFVIGYLLIMSSSKEQFYQKCEENRLDGNSFNLYDFLDFVEYQLSLRDFFYGFEKYKKMFYSIIKKIGRYSDRKRMIDIFNNKIKRGLPHPHQPTLSDQHEEV